MLFVYNNRLEARVTSTIIILRANVRHFLGGKARPLLQSRSPFNTHFFIQIIIIIIMITMKIEAILEKLGRGVEQRRKRIIEILR